MSVVMVHMFVPKHVQTLMEASFVDVIVVMYWTLMGLPVMVCCKHKLVYHYDY